jgi:hypothetical protein
MQVPCFHWTYQQNQSTVKLSILDSSLALHWAKMPKNIQRQEFESERESLPEHNNDWAFTPGEYHKSFPYHQSRRYDHAKV